MSHSDPACVWPVAATLGEGPVWSDSEGAAYFVDIKGGKIHRYRLDDAEKRSWSVSGQPSFIVPYDRGGYLVGISNSLWRFRPDATIALEPALHVEEESSGNRLNDGFVDRRGRLWFGSMCDAENEPTGVLYLLNEEGALRASDAGYVVTNGPVVSIDGRTLYHTNTFAQEIWKFDLAADGSLSNKRIFLNTPGPGWPDGMAVDAEGFVWIAFFGGWRIDRYSPAGQLVASVRFPCANITKVAFGGADLRTMFVTSATKGLTAEQRAQQPLAGGLFTVRADVPGLPQSACVSRLS